MVPPRRSAVALCAAVAMITAGLIPTTSHAAIPSQSTDPFVPLFTQADSGGKAANNSATVANLARWYVHVHGEASNTWAFGDATKNSSADSTLAQKLASLGVWVSQYRNGSYVSQADSTQTLFGEAASIEQNAALSIGTWWPGNYSPTSGTDTSTAHRVQSAITATQTTIRIAVSGTTRPSGTSTTWPYINSRDGDGDGNQYSENRADYIAWVRIDNEIMKVVAAPTESGGIVTLTVRRGIFGTSPASHSAGARVMSPTYIGNKNAAASDSGLAGTPNAAYPNKQLRYSIKIWQAAGYTWIANRIRDSFGGADLSGYNAVWLDVSSCSQYNNADPYGNPVFNWYDLANTKMTTTHWGTAQRAKVAGLRSQLPGVKFTGNSFSEKFDTCNEGMLANAYDGGVLENWMKHATFAQNAEQSFRIQKGNWPALYWVRWNYDFSGDIEKYKRLTYGTLLLSHRATATKFQYGGPWGLARPDDLYFWNFGTPLTSPDTLAGTATSTQGVYRRDYTKGSVIVNSSTTAKTISLGGTWYDVVKRTATGQPSAVSSVTIAAGDAAFVLKPV